MSLNTSRTVLYRNECCHDGRESSSDLRKICRSQNNDSETTNRTNETTRDHRKIMNAKKMGTVVLTTANTSKGQKEECTIEQCMYRARCYQCKDLVQRIRSLLDEIKAIRRNVSPGTMCNICKRSNPSGKCRRCEFLATRYKINETIDNDARQQRFKIWLCKVKQFLYTILERETCKHKLNTKTPASDELTNLLHELKSPLTAHEPEIGHFPSIDSLENITENKDILEQVLMRLRSMRLSNDISIPSNCICKYFPDKKLDQYNYKDTSIDSAEQVPPPTPLNTERNETQVKRNVKAKSTEKIKPREKITLKSKSLSKESKEKLQLKDPPGKKQKATSEENLISKLMQKTAFVKQPKLPKPGKPPTMPKIEQLPVPKRKDLKKIPQRSIMIEPVSESYIKCSGDAKEPTEMVKGDTIVPIERRMGMDIDSESVQPTMFKVTPMCADDNKSVATNTTATSTLPNKTKPKHKLNTEEKSGKGIIRYMLSNQEFIEKGWTLLPTIKIMRRMNIYKMVPANPKYAWFQRYKTQRIVHYHTGEKLAEIEEDGSGKWFYKNGNMALDYYCAQDANAGHRYVVYSSGENTDAGRFLPVTVLASFDYLGNGVVYDHYGNERLKYNQSEGMVCDHNIGPPGRWKWHTLNEPLVLQSVYLDACVRPNACLEEFQLHSKEDKDDKESSIKNKRVPNLDMLSIELENFMKEKAHKLLQEFKPFHIKMKALKINDQFSLKVLDQANIYLMFREGQTSIKLNLGMLLKSNEIVDTDTAEVSQVATPYDRRPAKSKSITDIQITLEKAKKLGKARGKLRT